MVVWERLRIIKYTSGSITVSSNYSGGGSYGIARVTGFVSSTEVDIEILQDFTSINATLNWAESEWSGATTAVGWPTSVAFHEGRLGWFGQSQTWLSQSNDYVGFASIDDQGNAIGDSGVIDEQLGSGPVDTISWGLSLTRLLLGREQSIGSARSSNFDQPLTPSDVVIRDCSGQGAERLAAVKIGKRGVYVQQSDRGSTSSPSILPNSTMARAT